MDFETKVLAVVKSVTDTRAYFFNGTMFLETEDSKIATEVFFALCDQVATPVACQAAGQSEISYDF